MTTVHAGSDGVIAIVKGAPEAVLPLCRSELGPDGESPLDRDALMRLAEDAANDGYRLLAFAEKRLESLPEEPSAAELERDLTFLGLVALADPPRPRVKEALASCGTAGITGSASVTVTSSVPVRPDGS